ncbi:MAG: glycosyltransferase family 39 protein [Bacteroidia bacterium]|nr:glycosyltransferase family 39 protein [Bacteroidia bacterium]
MKLNFKSGTILFYTMLLIVLMHVYLAKQKVMYGGDEIISYLCATVNQDNYSVVLHQQPPYGKLVPAGEWKKFFEINEPYAYNRIAIDLSKTDLHPPLYFWILHTFTVWFGMHNFNGIILNFLFQLLTLWPLFKLASLLLKNRVKAAYVVFFWSFTPALISGVLYFARPYMLLSLIHICYALTFFSYFMKQENLLHRIMLLLITTMGLLVHYSFFITGLCYLLIAVLYFRKTAYRKLLFIVLVWIISVIILWLIHPHFSNSFILQQERTTSFSFHQLIARIGKTGIGFMQFLIPVMMMKHSLMMLSETFLWIFFLGGTIILITLILVYKNTLKHLSLKVITHLRHDFFLPTVILISLAAIAPYLLFIFPFHAMGGQYLISVYPYLAMLLVLLFYRSNYAVKTGLITIFCLGSIVTLFDFYNLQNNKYGVLINRLQQQKLIIADNTDRRSFPRLIPYLKPEQLILLINKDDRKFDSTLQAINNLYPNYTLISSVQTGYEKQKFVSADPSKQFDLEDGILWVITEHHPKKQYY